MRRLFSMLLVCALLLSFVTACATKTEPEESAGPVISGPAADPPITQITPDPVPTENPGIGEQSPSAQEPEGSLEPPASPDSYMLPAIDDVILKDTPLLWDYVHGTLGWHTDIYRTTLRSDEYFLRNIHAPDIIYRDPYITPVAGYPSQSAGIYKLEYDGETLAAAKDALAKIPGERVICEGDWELYLLIHEGYGNGETFDPIEACLMYYDSSGELEEAHQGMLDAGGRRYDCFGGISISNLGDLPMDGYDEMRTPYAQGLGFATEWMRKEPWASNLSDTAKIDINHDFWNDWTLLSRCSVLDSGTKQSMGYIIPVDIDKFELHIEGYSEVTTLTGVQTWEVLEDMGLLVPDMMNKFVPDNTASNLP